MNEAPENLSDHTSRSMLWMTAQKWVTRVGGLATMMVLTRMLSPDEFGLATTASTLLPLVYVLSDAGFSTYIVQAEKVESRTLSTAFWFSLGSGTVLGIVLVALADPIALVLHLPAVAPMVRALALSMVVIALGSVPLALMRRRMRFRSLAMAEFVTYIVAQVLAIGVAFAGGGAWALVLQLIVAQVLLTIWVWIAVRWRPQLTFAREDFRAMGGFGIVVVASGLVTVARSWAESALVVVGIGVRELGSLNVSARLVTSAQDLSAAALLPVSMSAFAKVADDPPRMRSAYLRASAITHAAVSPLLLFMGVSAQLLIPFLFGTQQLAAAPLTPALAAVAFLGLGLSLDEGLLLGLGRPRVWLWLVIAGCAFSVAVTAVSVQFGVFVMLAAWVGGGLVLVLARAAVISWVVKAPIWRVLAPIAGVAGPSLVSGLIGYAVLTALGGLPAVLALVASGLSLSVSYVGATRLLRPRTYVDILTVLPDRLTAPVRRVFGMPRSGRRVDAGTP